MRKKQTSAGLTVNAISGTHVVLLGLNLSDAKRKGCLGFAIQREDHTEDERIWMRGMKTFEATLPFPDLGEQVSTREHPVQTFLWADYSAKPGYDYTYTVVPLYGTPKSLTDGDAVGVRVQTEPEFGQRHSVFFNSGAAASQEYARKFKNRYPSEVGPRAYVWLSRGLLEALLAFISRAQGDSYGIYGAVYEFQWGAVLEALKEVAGTGARVRIIFDAIPGEQKPRQKNIDAITDAKIKGLTIERAKGTLMHNKFFVLTKNDKPVAVWTGSTNLTENGIFGHSNCGHIVEDKDVAAAYLNYWQQLKGDPTTAEGKDWIEEQNPVPPNPWSEETTPVFSPHRGLGALDWYGEIAGGAKRGLFMTFAFGMHKNFQQVYEQNDGVLRFALMEKEGNGVGLAQGKIDIRRIRRLPNAIVALGNSLPLAKGTLMHNKFFVLTKNDKPVAVWTGSTNLTENGIFGHSNCGHIVEDKDVAAAYLNYWQQLKGDPTTAEGKDWIEEQNPVPPNPWSEETTPVFSPHRGLGALDWYGEIAGGAKRGLFMTFAFGMHKNFQQVYEQNDGVLRFALMEKEGNGVGLAQGKIDIRRIRRLPNAIVALGNSLPLNAFDRWLKELPKPTPNAHVKWIHTKYMLVDPLSDEPTVVTGSANWSGASTDKNDENMLVIRNHQRVADIYLGEFMRLYTHFAFREAVKIARDNGEEWLPKYLEPKAADWQKNYFALGDPRSLRRLYFAGL